MKNNLVITAVVVILVAGGAFFAGMKYQENKQPAMGRFNQRMSNGQMNNGQQTGSRIGRPLSGEILSVDENSLTVKLADNSSKIILLSDKTQINEATSAAKSALKTGGKVSVFGSENSDGSVSALNIQLNPQMGQRP